jgi:hypothetical protein
VRRLALVAALLAACFGVSNGSADTITFLTSQPGLVVSVDPTFGVSFVNLQLPERSAPAAEVDLYLPHGFDVDTALTPGQPAGFVSLGAGGTVLNTTLAPGAAPPSSCDPDPHRAIWLASFSALGRSVTIPFFVDATAGTEATLGDTVIRICLQADAFGAGGSPLQSLTIGALGSIGAPSSAGQYILHGLVMPFAGDGLTPDRSRAFDYQAAVPSPQRLTVKARVAARSTVRLTGALSLGGKAAPSGVRIDVFAQRTRGSFPTLIARPKTKADGTYSATVRLRTAEYLTVQPEEYRQPCSPGPTAGCSRLVSLDVVTAPLFVRPSG